LETLILIFPEYRFTDPSKLQPVSVSQLSHPKKRHL